MEFGPGNFGSDQALAILKAVQANKASIVNGVLHEDLAPYAQFQLAGAPVLDPTGRGPFFIPSPTIRFPERAEWGQGTETLAKLGALPPSGACVWQRLDA